MVRNRVVVLKRINLSIKQNIIKRSLWNLNSIPMESTETSFLWSPLKLNSNSPLWSGNEVGIQKFNGVGVEFEIIKI
jgi:hypothetical protein